MTKISNLPVSTTLTDNDTALTDDGATTRKLTLKSIKTYILA